MSYHRNALSGTTAAPVGDEPFPEPWGSYGQRAAAAILSRVRAIPGPRKKREMKKLLDKIDPSLWARTATFTRRYTARGAAPAAALHAGLARAMSSGVIAELHHLGKNGAPPRGQLAALGVVPVMPGGGAPNFGSGGQVAVTTDVSGVHVDGTCTSDGRLMWSGGQWRVKAPTDTCAATATFPASSVIASLAGRPLYVGPFPLDVTKGAQMTVISDPRSIPKAWKPWLAHAATVAGQALINAGKPLAVAPWPNYSGWQTDGVKGFITDGAGAVVTTSNKPPSYWQTKASGGHPFWPSKIASGVDGNGLPVHHVQYAGDPNTYDYYSMWDWLASIDPAFAAAYPAGMLDTTNPLTANNTTEYNPPFNLAPFAKWNHPVSGEPWGAWISIVPQDAVTAASSSSSVPEGAWSTMTDAPGTYVMQIGLGPIPQEPWYDSILDAILYVPGLIGDLLGDLGNLLGGLLCTTAAVGTASAGAGKAAGGGAAGAAAAGGAAVVNALCTGGKPPPAPAPQSSSALLPLAIAAAGLLVVAAVTRPKKKKPQAPAGAP